MKFLFIICYFVTLLASASLKPVEGRRWSGYHLKTTPSIADRVKTMENVLKAEIQLIEYLHQRKLDHLGKSKPLRKYFRKIQLN